MNIRNFDIYLFSLLKNENRDIVVSKYNRLIEKLKTNENPYASAARYIYD